MGSSQLVVMALMLLGLAWPTAASRQLLNRGNFRDRVPIVSVTSCYKNTNPGFKIPGRVTIAPFIEVVQVSQCRPNRRVFLGWDQVTVGDDNLLSQDRMSFRNSPCGTDMHAGLKVVNSLRMHLEHITSSRKRIGRSDGDGVASFLIPAKDCAYNWYQAIDWIDSYNCQTSEVTQLAPPPPPAAPPAAITCSGCQSAIKFGSLEEVRGTAYRTTQAIAGNCVLSDVYDNGDYDGDDKGAPENGHGGQEPVTCVDDGRNSFVCMSYSAGTGFSTVAEVRAGLGGTCGTAAFTDTW